MTQYIELCQFDKKLLNHPQNTIECENDTGRVIFVRQGNCAHIGSMQLHPGYPFGAQGLLDQTITQLKKLKVDTCHITPSSNHDAMKAILESNNFKPYSQNSFICSKLAPYNSSNTNSYVSFRFPYQFNNRFADESRENRPVLDIYLSHSASNDMTRIIIPDSSRKKEIGILTAHFDTKQSVIDANTNVNFSLYSHLKNKNGAFCLNQAGCCKIPLSDLISRSRQRNKNYVSLEMRIPSKASVEKAKIDLTIEPGSVVMSNLTVQSLRIRHEISQVNGQKLIQRYIDQCYDTFNNGRLKPTWQCNKNIHAYEYKLDDGTSIPAVGFHLFEPPLSGEQYWINALKICLERDGRYNIEQFVNITDEQFVASIMVRCCMLYANCCKYITDKVDSNQRGNRYSNRKIIPIESFNNLSTTDAGDCEDGGKQGMIQAEELDSMFGSFMSAFTHLKRMDSAHKALLRIIEVRKKYYVFASLGGVGSIEINGDYGQLKSMGAHEYMFLIPRSNFYKLLYRHYGAQGHPLMFEEDRKIGENLYPLVGEGTGILIPDGTTDETIAQKQLRQYIKQGIISMDGSRYNCDDIFKGIRQPFYYDRINGSSFYRTIVSLFTNEFFHRGLRYGEFAMLQIQNKRTTYSAKFEDVTAMRENVGLLAQPEIPQRLFYYMKEKLNDQHPIMPLNPPTNPSYNVSISDPVYDLISKTDSVIGKYISVDYYPRFDQMSKKRIKLLKRNAEEKGLLVDVRREPVCGKYVGLYRIVFYKRV